MQWYYPALTAAISWGIYYPLAETLLKRYSSQFLLSASHCTSMLLLSCIFFPRIKSDVSTLVSSSGQEIGLFFLLVGLALCANLSGFMAISMKNATLAAFLEISYPLFAAFFAYLIFSRNSLNLWTMLGGILISCGVVLIALKG
jgi:drug/metabolite transporter (DMT)-like permease